MIFSQQIDINDGTIGRGNRPYIIAEMACAHNGDVESARRLIDLAAEAGADAVQLQFFNTEHSVVPAHDVFKISQEIEFSAAQWRSLTEYARSLKIDVFACPYDTRSAELAIELGVDGIKLNSADLSNPDMLQTVAASAIPFTLGTGASTLNEISAALRIIHEHGGRNVVLMHGVQNFPTSIEDLNIARIELLKDVFNMPVGYHDHTDADDPFCEVVDLIAIGFGANIIEKHIVLDRSRKGLDYQAALEQDEFRSFVARIHKAWIAVGSKEIRPFSASDIKYRTFQKKSVVAAADLEAGALLRRADILFIRNVENGVAPIDFPELEGKRLRRSVARYDNIRFEDVE